MRNGRKWFYKRNKHLTVHYITARILCFWGIHLGTEIEDEDKDSIYSYNVCDYCKTRKELWRYDNYTLTIRNVTWEQ
jgi:hypothetical protein